MRILSTRSLCAALLAGAFCVSARAEVALTDSSQIVGTWLLESVAPALNKAKIPENRTWEFRADGMVITSGFNRHFGRDDEQRFKYVIADGKIKAEDPGRPGKTLDYTIYEKSGDAMILKGGLEGFYFFKKK